jgi:lipopolysaccharide transport system permease protein
MNTGKIELQKYTETIRPRRSLFDLRLKSVWEYRDLLSMFVKRDFVATYKQTILGPVWFILQPVMTTIMFTVVFGNFAKISTDGQPKILFYLAGITIWNYFSDSFNRTASVFTSNASIFGKVYFPRLIVPLSIVTSGLIRFSIQFLLFISSLLYYIFYSKVNVHPNAYAFLTPFLLILMAGLALGAGMIISSMTTKYRDFTYLISFGVTLLMYATPIIYPINSIPSKYKVFVMANPLTGIVETFRYSWLGAGSFSWSLLLYSFTFMIVLISFGILIFNKVEQNFMDTV